jgi:hypothetical protein
MPWKIVKIEKIKETCENRENQRRRRYTYLFLGEFFRVVFS